MVCDGMRGGCGGCGGWRGRRLWKVRSRCRRRYGGSAGLHLTIVSGLPRSTSGRPSCSPVISTENVIVDVVCRPTEGQTLRCSSSRSKVGVGLAWPLSCTPLNPRQSTAKTRHTHRHYVRQNRRRATKDSRERLSALDSCQAARPPVVFRTAVSP